VTPSGRRHAAIAALKVLWALPCSVLGALLGLPVLALGGSARRVGRKVEVALYPDRVPRTSRLARAPYVAITLGHVIVGVSGGELTRLRAHEQAHVRQYERLGPLFLPAYAASSLLAGLRGESPYWANRFERAAGREPGVG
jgi:hypothetical protein